MHALNGNINFKKDKWKQKFTFKPDTKINVTLSNSLPPPSEPQYDAVSPPATTTHPADNIQKLFTDAIDDTEIQSIMQSDTATAKPQKSKTSKKPKAKNTYKVKLANAVIVTQNIEHCGEVTKITHWITHLINTFKHKQVGLLGVLTETGIQNENELTQIKNWCTKQSIGMTAIYVDEAISHAITEARKQKKDPAMEYNKSTSYRRGGVLIFWTRPFPMQATKIELDTTLHWIKVTFTNNQENFAVIGLYNNQQILCTQQSRL